MRRDMAPVSHHGQRSVTMGSTEEGRFRRTRIPRSERRPVEAEHSASTAPRESRQHHTDREKTMSDVVQS